MNKFILFIIIISFVILSKNLVSNENKIIFKLNNKSFTSVDFDQRLNYLSFIGENDNIENKIALEDFISASTFFEYFLNNSSNDSQIDDEVNKIYSNIINANKDKGKIDSNHNKEEILKNLKIDYVRKIILEDILKSKKNEIFSENQNINLLYNFKINYINLDLNDFDNNIIEFNFKNFNELEQFLKKNNSIYFKQHKEIDDVNSVHNIIKENIFKNNYFFYYKKDNFITFVEINKTFSTYDGLIAKIVSYKTNQKIDKNNINCNYFNNFKNDTTNFITKEYDFIKLNNKIKDNLLNINDFIVIENDELQTYILLCDIKFNKDILNDITINKKINSAVSEIEKKFLNRYHKNYKLLLFNE